MLNQKYRYVAIDESGDIGNTKKSSRYFVLVAFMHNEENINRKIRKFIAKLNHNKSGKKISVLHARNDTDKIKLKLVKFLDTFNWQANCIVVDKNKNEVDYFECVKNLSSKLGSIESVNISMPITNKYDKNEVIKISDKMFFAKHTEDLCIQFSDFIAWCLYKNYEQEDSQYFDMIKDKVNLF